MWNYIYFLQHLKYKNLKDCVYYFEFYFQDGEEIELKKKIE